MEKRRIHAIVRGRVQGVGFRAATEDYANGLHLVGWVRNLADGTVELEAEGPSERIDELVSWLHQGPPAARVTGVDVTPRAVSGTETTFQFRW